MNFCIIGDSWAGNFPCNLGIFQKILEPLGHTIVNISAGGASNRGQLQQLEFQILNKNTNFDYIIWIYTESVRDFTEFVSLDYGDDVNAAKTMFVDLTYCNFYQDLNYIANQDFKYAQRLFEKFGIPFVVIGGAGVVDQDIKNYNFSEWTLHSWNQEISNLPDMPINCYTHHVVKMADYANYDKKTILAELNKIESLELAMKNKIKYPDTRHPSTELYPELVNRILKNITHKEQR
jgi:hypothetical protein